VLLLAWLVAPALGHAQTPGWVDVDLGSGHRARRYLPTSVRACDPLPVLVFLHGAGGTPEAYESQLTPDAEALGMALVLPLSTSAGWSDADTPIILAALNAVAAELVLDDTRTYLGGHSAGGAWAYILAYGGTGIAAVFTLSAPYYGVSSVAEPSYRAPIHMYYGDMDPNYTSGGTTALENQWTALGVPHETDLEAGFGHSSWPPSSIRMGLDFLLARRYPGTPPGSTCGGADAGSAIDAATSVVDSAVPGTDGGAGVDASSSSLDASPSEDAGTRRRIASGCGCRAPARGGAGSLALLGLVLVLFRQRVLKERSGARRAAARCSCPPSARARSRTSCATRGRCGR
jgi:pimeloyl-ACP methyl ester carboxylesterase